MTKIVLAAFFTFICNSENKAQYYYKDVLNNKQLTTEMAALKEQKIKSVVLNSFEFDGTPSKDFFCEKKINKNYTAVETFTKSFVTLPSLFIASFNNDGSLIKTKDSSEISSSTTYFTYDTKNNLYSSSNISLSSDDDFKNEIKEEHIYEYNETGLAIKMLRIKNFGDTIVYSFTPDENNNVGSEKNNKTGETHFYYYDSKNRLTDIVRFNKDKQKMLPDYIFEYNNAGQLTQMTSVEEGGSFYYIWKYTYDNGLRTSEKCFSKDKKLMGKIEYEYK